jgi:membrane-associated protease RseP (regulator of RpoE activity)
LPAPEVSVESIVRTLFKVNDTFQLPDGETEYRVVYAEDSKGSFEKLNRSLDPLGLVAWLTGSREDCILLVRKKQPAPPSKSRIPLIMALLTFASVVLFAIVEQEVFATFAPGVPWYEVFFEFGACVWIVIFFHELGHRLASRRTKTVPPRPYIIPGIPAVTFFLPSLGIVSSQREPAINRDRLFDVMAAGPLFALAAAILLYAVGGLTSVQSTLQTQGTQMVNSYISVAQVYPSALQYAIDLLTAPFAGPAAAGLQRLSPIAEAAEFGFPLTFISLLPMAFFDGGYIFSAVFGSGRSRAATYVSVLVLIVVDAPYYWALAIVVLLMAGRPFDIQTRDDVSGISRGRKALFIGLIVLAVLSVPIPQNLATIPLG